MVFGLPLERHNTRNRELPPINPARWLRIADIVDRRQLDRDPWDQEVNEPVRNPPSYVDFASAIHDTCAETMRQPSG